jgi:hypothetical protein
MRCLPIGLALALTLLAGTRTAWADSNQVALGLVQTAAWSPGDAVREGAGEFLVLLEGARLQKASARSGLIVLGNQHGVLQSGGERALRRLALTGLVVVRLARDGQVATIPDSLYVDATGLTLEMARMRLQQGLEHHGPPPVVSDPDHPTEFELASIQMHLTKIQTLFAPPADAVVALR